MSITTQAVKDINVPAFANNMSVANMLSGMSQKFQARPAQPVKDAAEQDDFENNKSIDERAFSDFGIDGSEKDYKQDGRVKANNAYWMQDKEQEKVDDVELAANEAQEFMEEKRREKLTKLQAQQQFGNFDFTHGDFDEALDEIVDNNEVWAKKNGYSEEEADEARYHAVLMQGMTMEERENHMKWLENNAPETATMIDKQAKEENLENKNKVEVSNQTLKQENRAREISSQYDIAEKPDSQIASIFNKEVANVGVSAQNFVLDEKTPDSQMQKEIEPFVLDI